MTPYVRLFPVDGRGDLGSRKGKPEVTQTNLPLSSRDDSYERAGSVVRDKSDSASNQFRVKVNSIPEHPLQSLSYTFFFHPTHPTNFFKQQTSVIIVVTVVLV
jgi:hypothetical protein